MDQLTLCTPFLFSPKDPWAISSSMLTINQSLKFSILTPTYKIGDPSQVFYSTLYTSKSTQDEDSKKQVRIGHVIIKRIKRLLEKKQHSISEDQSTDAMNQARKEPSFEEGLSRVLSGLNAATTRNVISATMAHLTPCNNGSQFLYSHDFSNLLVGKLEATLEGQELMYASAQTN
jgi:hypothetical protein